MEDGEAMTDWLITNREDLADILGVPLPEDMSVEDLAMSLTVLEMGAGHAA